MAMFPDARYDKLAGRIAELERENELLRKAVDVAVYFADNLQRVMDHKPVRGLAESRASFERIARPCSLCSPPERVSEEDKG